MVDDHRHPGHRRPGCKYRAISRELYIFREHDDEEFVAHMPALLGSAGVHAMGARTYRDMAGHRPFQKGPEAEAMNSIPKVVFSRSPNRDALGADHRLLRGPGLRGRPVGGRGRRTDPRPRRRARGRALVRKHLVDEYHLLKSPFALGGGSALFTELTRLQLVDVRRFPRGAISR